jgi:ABC-type phosphate/phosphonate transport system ATPase subunit
MESNFIHSFDVKGLWGHKDYPINLNEDVNVIIGPNASGKTTLINILYDSLSGNIPRLCRTEFAEVVLTLSSFESLNKCILRITKDKDELIICLKDKEYRTPLAPYMRFGEEYDYSQMGPTLMRNRRLAAMEFEELRSQLRQLVPAVWLPVSRRLPIADEEEIEQRRLHRRPLESVDECLAALITSLREYRVGLDSELAELRRDFQRHALENILYDKNHDKALLDLKSFEAPSEHDKQALLKAFHDVGLVDKGMERRIDAHFAAARSAAKELSGNTRSGISHEVVFIIPLINRTRAIVEFAQELENRREKLFLPLHKFESTVNSFLNEKHVKVSDKGDLLINPMREDPKPIEWRHLSSGEKQILILLIQALLSEKSPVVYVADEPELSLHVDWQEKLLRALTSLAGQCQFIVSTHSPDIASGFGDKIIDLAKFK